MYSGLFDKLFINNKKETLEKMIGYGFTPLDLPIILLRVIVAVKTKKHCA